MKNLSNQKKLILGIQHVLAMFGATVLVPFLTGLNPSIALICAGVGTLLFHSVTKGIVPIFLGSSFAFISSIALVYKNSGMAILKGGIISAGLVYVIMSLIILKFGVERVKSFFPPIVIGPVIMVIGLRMSETAINMAIINNNTGTYDYRYIIVSTVVVISMIVISMLEKSFFKLVPILISVMLGYILSIWFGLVDFEAIKQAPFFGLSHQAFQELITIPKFDLSGIIAIAPIAIVVFIEHIGDVTTNGMVVGKDFFKDPGIHRTMLGDGLATMVAGLLGGPANTTYGENTGVLAVTKVYNPEILRIAAIFAILLGLLGKFGAIIQTIPTPVMGGISIILFGMISSIGLRTVVNEKIDFSSSRNLIIASIIFVVGIGVNNIPIYGNLTLSGLSLCALLGIVLNKVIKNDVI